MLATGGGKTAISLHLAQSAIAKGKRVCFVADRITLINQTVERAREFGITDIGVIQASHPLRRPEAMFQVCSTQTLSRRDWPMGVGLVICDEAHTRGTAWIDYLKKNKDVAAIGLSATPYTKGLGKIFSNLVCGSTMAELTKLGYLVPFEVYTCKQPTLTDDMVDSLGEWRAKDVEREELKIVGDVIEEWKSKANGLKTIAFGRSIAYCDELVERFNRAGVLAAAFTQHTNAKTREALVREFKSGAVKVLVSVEALAKGFDETSIECVIDARPFRKSLSSVQQMWGRGARSHPGKTKCILLDFSGNVSRFWPDFERIFHNGLDKLDDNNELDSKARTKEDDEDEQKSCPQCGFMPFAKICMECGYERPAAKSKVKEEDGILDPISITIKKDKATLEKEQLYLQLCKYAKSKGMKIGWAYHEYMKATKQEPKREWSYNVESKLDGIEVGEAVLHYLRVKNLRKMYATKFMRSA
jgi:DNA repair protein RadD